MIEQEHCPCCGQPMPESALTWNHHEGLLAGRGRAVSFGPVTANIFDVLWRAKGRAVPAEELVARVYANDIDGGPLTARKAVQVLIFKLREVLPAFRLAIVSPVWRDGGYRLVPLAQAEPAADEAREDVADAA
jgi:DNA-binding response OmpR family regulator